MALNRSDKSRILRRYFPGMTRNSEMSTEPSTTPFTYTAFGATIGANVVMYLATASIAAVRMSRARGGTIPGRP